MSACERGTTPFTPWGRELWTEGYERHPAVRESPNPVRCFPHQALGGAGVVTHELARGVQRAGVEVHVVSVHQGPGKDVVRDDLEFPVYRVFSRCARRFVAYFGLK